MKAIGIKVTAIYLNKSTQYQLVAQPQVQIITNKLVYLVWLASYISTCLQTLSHVWLPSKYGIEHAHTIRPYCPDGMAVLEKHKRYQNRCDVNINTKTAKL